MQPGPGLRPVGAGGRWLRTRSALPGPAGRSPDCKTPLLQEETEEWRRFQADLQTAVVVANDIKCEAQQELRAVRRRLLEEEEKNARLQRALGDAQARGRWVTSGLLTACSRLGTSAL